jgi:lysophospholipase L1-like esterase
VIRPLLAALTLAASSALIAQPAQAATNPLLVIGDSWTQGVGDRVSSNGLGWSPVAASLLGMALTQDGKGGSGYVNRTTYGDNTFGQRVYRHPADAYRTVIFQGSTNDKAYLSTLAANANMTLRAAKKRYPSALIVVVGPTSISGTSDAATVKVNDKLRAAAWAAGVPFIDAIGEGWFVPGDWSRYSDAATGHPNDAAYQVIGRHIADDVANLR